MFRVWTRSAGMFFIYLIKASRQKKVFASPHIKHQAHSYKSCLICLWVWVELTQNTAIYTHDWYCFVEPGPSTVSKTGKPQIGALHQIHLVPPKDRLFAINSLSSAWEFPLRLGKNAGKFPRFENPLFCLKFASSWVTCWHVKWNYINGIDLWKNEWSRHAAGPPCWMCEKSQGCMDGIWTVCWQ